MHQYKNEIRPITHAVFIENYFSDLSDASAVTNEYVENVKGATASMTGFASTYNESVEELTASNNTV